MVIFYRDKRFDMVKNDYFRPKNIRHSADIASLKILLKKDGANVDWVSCASSIGSLTAT